MEVKFHPKQLEALQALKKHQVVLYGGARGGGKSWLVRAWQVLRRFTYPGTTGVIIRKTYPELLNNHIEQMWLEYPELQQYYNKADKVIYFPTNPVSRLYFRHLQNPDDVYNFQGQEFADIALDETGQHLENTFKILLASNRNTRTNLKPRMLLTANPGGVGHCVPFGDVLTSDGWKDIRDVNLGDFVATLLPDRTLGYREVKQLWSEQYDGELLTVSQRNGVEITCTPNHKIARKIGDNYNDARFTLTEAKDMPKNSYIVRKSNGKIEGDDYQSVQTFSIPKVNGRVNLAQPLDLLMSDFSEFMGWFLSEGYTLEHRAEVGISQSKLPQREKIRNLLTRMGIHFREDDKSFKFYSHSWAAYLRQFGKCRDKFIPDVIRNLNKENLQIFFNAMIDGDGHRTEGDSGHYYTISKRLHDGMSEIAVLLGYVVTEHVRQRKNREGLSYELNFSRLDSVGDCEVKEWSTESYSGNVYCIGVDETHNFFIRQNGKVWVSGNSWLKRLFVERRFYEGEEPQHFAFIKSLVFDNPTIMEKDPDYVQKLRALPEDLRRAYLEGDWNVFVGQFFTEFRMDKHVIKPRFDYHKAPKTWNYVLSWDEGTLRPRAVYVLAQDQDGRVEAIWEYYRTGETAVEAASNIVAQLTENGLMPLLRKQGKFVYDPSMDIQSNQTGISTSRIVNGYLQMRQEPANNDRIEGARVYREYLHWDSLTDPLFRVWDCCEYLIREIPSLVHAANRKGEDIESDSDDHGYDSTRYGLMSLKKVSVRLKAPRAKDPWADDPIVKPKIKKSKYVNKRTGW